MMEGKVAKKREAVEAPETAGKKAIDERVVEAIVERYLREGQIIGIGTSEEGITFLKKIALKAEEKGMDVSIVPTSAKMAAIVKQLGMGTASLNEKEVDLAIEFVDLVDENFNYIKRDSCSLVRDKMIGQSAAELIAVSEHKNLVKRLKGEVPFEIATFAWKRTLVQLDQLGKAVLRTTRAGEPIKTETGHLLVDVEIDEIHSLEDVEFKAKEVPGVLESGLFIGYADRILLYNGKIEVKSRIGPELEIKEKKS